MDVARWLATWIGFWVRFWERRIGKVALVALFIGGFVLAVVLNYTT